jgi:hypothetical protein
MLLLISAPLFYLGCGNPDKALPVQAPSTKELIKTQQISITDYDSTGFPKSVTLPVDSMYYITELAKLYPIKIKYLDDAQARLFFDSTLTHVPFDSAFSRIAPISSWHYTDSLKSYSVAPYETQRYFTGYGTALVIYILTGTSLSETSALCKLDTVSIAEINSRLNSPGVKLVRVFEATIQYH